VKRSPSRGEDKANLWLARKDDDSTNPVVLAGKKGCEGGVEEKKEREGLLAKALTLAESPTVNYNQLFRGITPSARPTSNLKKER